MHNTINNTHNHVVNKILSLEQLAKSLDAAKAEGQRVVQCHGVFDLLHIGHIRHFGEAKAMGDVLVVTITPDRYVNKGPNRPAFEEDLRAEAIASLDCVDYVAINRWPTATEAIKILAPHFYVKGTDYADASKDRSGGIDQERDAVQSVGGQVAFTDEIIFSSSNLLNRQMSVFSDETKDYLSHFSERHSSDQVLDYLKQAQALKVLVIGETIIDEYVYCESVGKSGKEPVLATRQLGNERFAGGIAAVANHLSAVSDSVSMLTFLGAADSYEDFVREKLDPGVEPIFLKMDGDSPTIVKRRFVENHPFQKLFELYIMDDGENKPNQERLLDEKIKEALPNFDVVLVTDYGHGMIGPQAVELLCNNSKFLAVNTQLNAGNLGFNTVSKYQRADFVCVSENEIRLEARSRRKDLKDIVLDVADRLSCMNIMVTQGPQGSLNYSSQEGFIKVPAFATEVIDRVGAGDTVFAVASLLSALKAPSEIIGFVGNVAGAEAVATVGNRTSLERSSFFSHVETLLK